MRQAIPQWVKKMWHKWSEAQKDVCPHCGHYCTGKSVYCLPPIGDN